MKYKKITIYIRHESERALDLWIGGNIYPALQYQLDDNGETPILDDKDLVVKVKSIKSCSKFKRNT